MRRKSNPQKKLHVKKGDTVILTKAITSAKGIGSDRPKGYQGKVLEVLPEAEKVIVEGVNLRYHHQPPSQANPQGGRMEREVPIHASNVMPVDSNGDATRVGRKRVEDSLSGNSRWVRYAKTTGEELDT